MKEMNIPVGVSDFEEIRKNGYYYIDKSGLIGELLSRTGTKVTLITRPQRFGKTLGIDCRCNLYTGLLSYNKGCKVNSERTSMTI